MNVYQEIQAERDYQDTKWGQPLGEDTVSLFRRSMIKTAAICVAAIESVDRQRAQRGKAFYE